MGWCDDIKSKKYNRPIYFPFKYSAEKLHINRKIYDIFDKSQNEFYSKWNDHMSDYSFFYRENFKDLTSKILLRI